MREDSARDSRRLRDRNLRRITLDKRALMQRRAPTFFLPAMLTHSAPAANLSLLVDNIEERKLKRAKGRDEIRWLRILTGHNRPALAGLLTLLAENATIVISAHESRKRLASRGPWYGSGWNGLRELGVK